jgi:hypothetical protein
MLDARAPRSSRPRLRRGAVNTKPLVEELVQVGPKRGWPHGSAVAWLRANRRESFPRRRRWPRGRRRRSSEPRPRRHPSRTPCARLLGARVLRGAPVVDPTTRTHFFAFTPGIRRRPKTTSPKSLQRISWEQPRPARSRESRPAIAYSMRRPGVRSSPHQPNASLPTGSTHRTPRTPSGSPFLARRVDPSPDLSRCEENSSGPRKSCAPRALCVAQP